MREACVRVKLFILSPVMKEEKNYTQAKLWAPLILVCIRKTRGYFVTA